MRKTEKIKLAVIFTVLAIIISGCAGVLNPAGYFKANLDNTVANCGGTWKLTTTDPYGVT